MLMLKFKPKLGGSSVHTFCQHTPCILKDGLGVVSSKQVRVTSKEPVWVSPRPPEEAITLLYKLNWKGWSSPPTFNKHIHLSLSYFQRFLRAQLLCVLQLWFPTATKFSVSGLPLACYTLSPSGVSPHRVKRAQYKVPFVWSRAVSDPSTASSRRLLRQINKCKTWQRRLRVQAGTGLHPH